MSAIAAASRPARAAFASALHPTDAVTDSDIMRRVYLKKFRTAEFLYRTRPAQLLFREIPSDREGNAQSVLGAGLVVLEYIPLRGM